jgi:hypothetical protein
MPDGYCLPYKPEQFPVLCGAAIAVWSSYKPKTVACVNELVHRAVYFSKKDDEGNPLRNARFAYIAPQLKQAKKIAWMYLKDYTEGLVEKSSESELWVKLRHNGAEICIYGADNPDSFRGQYFDGVILDEYGDMSVWGKGLYIWRIVKLGMAYKGKNGIWIWRKTKVIVQILNDYERKKLVQPLKAMNKDACVRNRLKG